MKPIRIILILLFAGFLTAVPYSNAQNKTDAAAEMEKPSIAISEEMDDVVIRASEHGRQCDQRFYHYFRWKNP
jgi:hypothetical protein